MQLLGGMLTKDPAAAYQDSVHHRRGLDTDKANAEGDAAFGRSLMGLYGAHPTGGGPPVAPPGGPPAPPTAFPGTPSPPRPPMGAPPGGMTPPTGGPPGAPGAGTGGPPMGGATPAPSGPGNPFLALLSKLGMGAPPGGMSGGGPSPSTPPGLGSPGGPGLPPGGAPASGGGPMPPRFGTDGPAQGLSWQDAVTNIIRFNPGIDQNPRALARAVDRYMPLMKQESLDQWRAMQMELRGGALDVREQGIRQREEADRRRSEDRGKDRESRERLVREKNPELGLYEEWLASPEGQAASATEKLKQFQHLVKGRETGEEKKTGKEATEKRLRETGETRERQRQEELERKKTEDERRQGRFNEREERLKANAQARQDRDVERLRLAREDLERKIKSGDRSMDIRERNQLLSAWRAKLDAEHKRVQEVINAYSQNSNLPMGKNKDGSDKPGSALLRDAEREYKDAIKAMDDFTKGKSTGKGDREPSKPSFEVGKIYPGEGGKFRYKGGEVTDAKNWEKVGD